MNSRRRRPQGVCNDAYVTIPELQFLKSDMGLSESRLQANLIVFILLKLS